MFHVRNDSVCILFGTQSHPGSQARPLKELRVRSQDCGVWFEHCCSLAARSLAPKYCRTNWPNKMMCRVVSSNILTLFPYTHIINYFCLSSTSLSSYHPHGLCCFFSAKASTKWVWHSPLLSLTPRHSALHIDILHIMVEWINENSVWFFNISLMSFQLVNYSVIPKCPELHHCLCHLRMLPSWGECSLYFY